MRIYRMVFIGIALLFATPALAGGVVYVNYATLMQQAPQVKASQVLLKREFAPRLKAMEKQQATLKLLRRQLDNWSPGDNPLQRASLIMKFRHTKDALQKAERTYRARLGLRRIQLQDNFKQVMDNDIKAYAKAHTIELVIKGGGIYVGRAVDATAAILDRLRQDYRQAQAQGQCNPQPRARRLHPAPRVPCPATTGRTPYTNRCDCRCNRVGRTDRYDLAPAPRCIEPTPWPPQPTIRNRAPGAPC